MLMKKILFAAVLLQGCMFIACKPQVKKRTGKRKPDSVTMVNTDTMIQATDTNVVAMPVQSWASFETYNGKYALDVRLFEQPPLKGRFKALLGKDVKDFLERHEVTPPIEIENAVLFSEGCKPHDCSLDESAIVIDMKKDVIYAGIARKKVLKLYSEKGDTLYPEKLKEWRRKFYEDKI